MYSVVLMAAIASGTATPDFGHRWGCHGGFFGGRHGCNGCYGGGGCSGCSGGWGCSGCYGGCACSGCYANGSSYSSCYAGYASCNCYGYSGGGWWGSGCYAGYGCYGAGAGCYGWGGNGWGCYGCQAGAAVWSCGGCYGGGSGYGMPHSGGIIVPGTMVTPGGGIPERVGPPDVNNKKGKDNNGDEVSGRGRLVVELPEDARLYIDEQPMKTTSGRRVFQTPPLAAGQTYYYLLRAEVTREGRTQRETVRVLIRPGRESYATFPTLAPAPRTTTTASR
jgi:uncharacterized protein (TIGR03000 family)